jgi:hypothetical protein
MQVSGLPYPRQYRRRILIIGRLAYPNSRVIVDSIRTPVFVDHFGPVDGSVT